MCATSVNAGILDIGGKITAGVSDSCGNIQNYIDQGDIRGKIFGTGVKDANGNFPPVSTTRAVKLPPMLMTPVVDNDSNIRLPTP
jgi:hypothetical protein